MGSEDCARFSTEPLDLAESVQKNLKIEPDILLLSAFQMHRTQDQTLATPIPIRNRSATVSPDSPALLPVHILDHGERIGRTKMSWHASSLGKRRLSRRLHFPYSPREPAHLPQFPGDSQRFHVMSSFKGQKLTFC